jgi:hypothetical protein
VNVFGRDANGKFSTVNDSCCIDGTFVIVVVVVLVPVVGMKGSWLRSTVGNAKGAVSEWFILDTPFCMNGLVISV